MPRPIAHCVRHGNVPQARADLEWGVMSDRATRRVAVGDLRMLMERMLTAAGCQPEVAAPAAGVVLEADLRGIGLQGLDHIHTMIRGLRNGKIRPDGKPQIVREGSGFEVLMNMVESAGP